MAAYQSMPPQMPPTSGSLGPGLAPSPFMSAPPGSGPMSHSMMPPMTNFNASMGGGSIPQTQIPGTGMPQGGGPMTMPPMTSGPLMSAASLQGGYQQAPVYSMPNMNSMPAMPGGPVGSMPPMSSMGPAMSMPPMSMPPLQAQGPPLAMQGQYMPNVARPQMTGVANPPVAAGNIQYGPSYKMQYQRRSTADRSAVKYTGFLPLEGVYEEDTCRVG
eukprot:TRINITY_DN94680_c0_g1_i1.p1 TRINITY_DN94680_c0_g1~~TRINITY_DN94680_c0_g1_i1.p1  ORF type:complete len:216 (-),score=33.86 TRINITY_DN94680_c0_g1_i1:127-774(-)